jgi:hypothetical protein
VERTFDLEVLSLSDVSPAMLLTLSTTWSDSVILS